MIAITICIAVTKLFSGCKDEEIDPLISSFTYKDEIDFFSLTSTSTGEISDYKWHISGNQQTILLNPTEKSITLELPTEATTVNVSLTVQNNERSSTSSQNIDLPQLTFNRQFGLGRNTNYELSNNVDYVWYIDQLNTGQHYLANCGPACVTMAIKWADPFFPKTAEDARNTYLPEGGLWGTYTIIDYLSVNYTDYFVTTLTEISHLTNQLDCGNIAILCIDMFYVRNHTNNGRSEWRIDKFYNISGENAGHFIVVKGYKIVDRIVWFEVYDPASMGARYYDGTLKGLDRYYRGEDIMRATNVWWPYMIVISNPAMLSVRSQAIDPSIIVHQLGR